MALSAMFAAASGGVTDFLVGAIVGIAAGVVVGPAFRSLQAYREWRDASHEARLTERFLERLEVDPDEAGDVLFADERDPAAREEPWQARR